MNDHRNPPSPEDLDAAIEAMQRELDKPMEPRIGKLLSDMDQLRARVRDMAPTQYLDLIDRMIADGEYEREDLEEWFKPSEE